MVVVIKPGTSTCQIESIIKKLQGYDCTVKKVQGKIYCTLNLIGDTGHISIENIKANECVDKVIRVQEPFERVNRLFQPEDTVINIDNRIIDRNHIAIIAGPCSVESREQIIEIAQNIKSAGAHFLRGGAFKPRTSPYSFQGLRYEGLELLKYAKEKTGLPIVTEAMSIRQLEDVALHADIVQIGARNMQNFELLKEVGKIKNPVLLKRGLSATINEFLMAAEYIMSGGNSNIILCERGIRTFETSTRNTLDISAIPVLKRLTHLPVIVDPSHAAGDWRLVEPLAKAAVAVGADGLMIEVHNDPQNAKSDGEESLTFERFKALMQKIREIGAIEKRVIDY